MIHWSTGEVADSIIVKEPGLYYALLNEIDACEVKTFPVEVIVDPDTVRPQIIYEGTDILCKGELATLSASLGNEFQWSSGDTTQTITVSESGDYVVLVQGYCASLISDTLHIDFVSPELPVTEPDTFGVGEPAILTASGDSIVWYDETGTTIIGTGPVLVLDNLTETTAVNAQNVKSLGLLTFNLGPAEHAGATKYNGGTINGGLEFEVFNPMILNSFTVFTDSAGPRIIEIIEGGDVFYAQQVDLVPGANLISMDIEIPAGNYTVSTNSQFNTENFGGISPILWRTFEAVSFPYVINDYISINTSTYGDNYYYYFYDWQISTAERFCYSDLVPVNAVSELDVSNEELSNDDAILLSPNPTTGIAKLEIKAKGDVDVMVYHPSGVMIYHSRSASLQNSVYNLDLTSFPGGTYMVQIVNKDRVYFRKLVKLD